MPLLQIVQNGPLHTGFAGPGPEVRQAALQEYEPEAVRSVGRAGNEEEFALEANQVGRLGQARLKLRAEDPRPAGDGDGGFVREMPGEEGHRTGDRVAAGVGGHLPAKGDVHLERRDAFFEQGFPVVKRERDLVCGAVAVGVEQMPGDVGFGPFERRGPVFAVPIVAGVAEDASPGAEPRAVRSKGGDLARVAVAEDLLGPGMGRQPVLETANTEVALAGVVTHPAELPL